jgi:hypothetical protein
MDNQRVDWPHLGDGSQRKGSRNHLHHAYSAQVHEDDVRAVDADGVTIAPRGLLGRCYLRKDIAQQSPRLDLQPPRDPRDVVDRTLRSDRSMPLRYARSMPHSWASAPWLSPRSARSMWRSRRLSRRHSSLTLCTVHPFGTLP